MMQPLIDKLNRMKIDENAIWFEVITRDVQLEIIRLNTMDQLFDEGIDANDNSIGDYSDASVQIYGKRAGHITLHDEGDFYASFRVKVTNNEILILAKDTGKYDEPLTEVYGKDILGLTKENIGVIRNMILDEYRKQVRKQIQAA